MSRTFRFALFFAAAGWALAQSPAITPPLQSGQTSSGPTLGNAITSGTTVPAFLYINGSFDPASIVTVTWQNTSTNVSTTFTTQTGIVSVTATQIIVNLPNSLFSALVTNPVTVNVTVAEQIISPSPQPPVTSNAAQFLINPPLSSNGPNLAPGTVGVAYSQIAYSGGTAPYVAAAVGGTPPPGLTLPRTGGPLAGTPTTPGDYTFNARISDSWSNSISVPYAVQIVGVPTITPPLVPASATAGSPSVVQITITGTNFLVPTQVGNSTFTGSVAQWTVSGQTTTLATSVTSTTQAVATVPANLLQAAATAGITMVQQSNGVASNSVAFPVLGPSITNLSPSSAAAGGAGFTLTVTGANFLSGSQIFFGSAGLTTTAQSSTSLTAPVSAAQIASAGPVAVTVTNPGGSRSGASTFTVGQPLQITTISPLTSGMAGTAYSTTFAASGGTPPYGFTLGQGGPPGLGFAGGVLSGTPTTAGTFNFNVSATDAAQNSTSKAFQVVIAPALAITTASLPNGQVGAAYSAQLAATGGFPPYTWTAGGLPNGVTVTSTGALGGTPTANGTFTVAVTVTDSAQNQARQSYPVTITAPVPVITSLSPASAVAGAAGFVLTVNGSNFVSGAQIRFAGTGLTTTFVSATSLTAPVTAAMVANAGSSSVTVVNPGNVSSAPASFAVVSKLTILTTSLPSSQTTNFYDFFLQAAGGVPPYTWSATGLPGTLTLNPATGEIKGTAPTAGNFTVSVAVTDTSGQTATAQYPVSVTTPPVPLQIVTPSPLPPATVGVPYSASFAANGGTSPYTFTLQGTAPPGLPFSQGVLNGTPTTPGQFAFGITATDSANGTASKQFLLVVQPATLTVTGSVSDSTVGAAISDQFGATGGVPPYSLGATGSLPSGTSFANGTLSGTLTAAGTFNFTVTAMDSTGTTASKSFTIHVTAAPITIATASLPGGQVGAPYSAQLAATGGVPPYTWAIGGVPSGVTASASGGLSGTPAAAGAFNVSATVTDTAGNQASKSFAVTITGTALAITTTSLPGGAVGTPYSAGLTATGGVPPYTWAVGGLPAGVSADSTGAISGTPAAAGVSNVTATVTDSKGATVSAGFTVTIGPAALKITTASLSSGVAGTAVSINLAATGGVPPYSWTIGGLPPGVSGSAAGGITGTPSAPGSFTVTATVTDSAGSTASASLPWTITLPSAPPLTFTGLPASSNPGSQSTLQIGLGSAYPVDVMVALTLTFAPTTGPDDPAVQFSTGGRTANITVPAGQTTGAATVGVQTGTVAGTITITAQLTAAGQNVTPTPVPSRTIQVPATAPVITSVTAASSGAGFTVTVTGYSSTREVSTALFVFTAASGANLQTGQVSVAVGSAFTSWYQSSAAAPFGGQFTLSQPFTVNGSLQAVSSVTVTLTNTVGTSAGVSATIH